MKASPRAPMTFSMEVEPSVATVPESAAGASVWGAAAVCAGVSAGAAVGAGWL